MVDFDNMKYNKILFYYDFHEACKAIFVKENPWREDEYVFVFKNTKMDYFVRSVHKQEKDYFYEQMNDFLDEIKERENNRYKRIYLDIMSDENKK